jgi:hypothetical protein
LTRERRGWNTQIRKVRERNQCGPNFRCTTSALDNFMMQDFELQRTQSEIAQYAKFLMSMKLYQVVQMADTVLNTLRLHQMPQFPDSNL